MPFLLTCTTGLHPQILGESSVSGFKANSWDVKFQLRYEMKLIILKESLDRFELCKQQILPC